MPSHEIKVRDLQIKYSNIKSNFVGAPLNVSIELCKQALAYTLGFQWLMPTISSKSIPNVKIKLPSFIYYYGDASSFAPPAQSYLMNLLGPQLVSGFALGWQQYRLNPVNFLFVGLNYIARNLGKVIGALAVSPFTIPAFIAIKSYFFIKIGIENVRHFFSGNQDDANEEQNTIENDESEDEQKTNATALSQDTSTTYGPLFPAANSKTVQSANSKSFEGKDVSSNENAEGLSFK